MNTKEIYTLVLSSLVIQGFKSTTISVDICANGYIILSLICNILVVVDLVAAGGSSKCLFNWEFGGHQTVVEQLLWLSVCLWQSNNKSQAALFSHTMCKYNMIPCPLSEQLNKQLPYRDTLFIVP